MKQARGASEGRLRTGAAVEFAQLEAEGDNVGRLAGGPVSVGGEDEGIVGEAFNAGVGAIGAVVILHEADAVLAGAAIDEILIAADPGDPIAAGGALVAHVAEGDQEAAIAGVLGLMTVAGEDGGQGARLSPGGAFVV